MNAALRIARAIPLLGFALILANLLALLSEGFDTDLLAFTMPSGGELVIHAGHLVVLLGLVLLAIEILKTASSGPSAASELVASGIVFAVALLELLMLAPFAHGAFLILTLMMLTDVVVGLVPARGSSRHE
ncbi:MAG TPA: hypothetical protein VFG21_00790 [Xanthomonadaceae bacterium]|nr:hypothetical protein [Xanthomonadaceae bacterium]